MTRWIAGLSRLLADTRYTRKVSSTSDPTVSSDSTAGYRVGDIWVNTTTKVAFELVDATAGAAVWGALNAQSHPGMVAGRYYVQWHATASNSAAITENRLYFCPLFVPRTQAFDRLGVNIGTGAGDATFQLRWGIWKNSAGRPGALVVDAGVTTPGTGTGNITVTISQTLAPGWHWLGVIGNRNGGSGSQPSIRGYGTVNTSPYVYMLGETNPDSTGNLNQIYHDQTVASWGSYTLPDPAPAPTISSGNNVMIWARAA